jgi:hypothetical protein
MRGLFGAIAEDFAQHRLTTPTLERTMLVLRVTALSNGGTHLHGMIKPERQTASSDAMATIRSRVLLPRCHEQKL